MTPRGGVDGSRGEACLTPMEESISRIATIP